LVLRLVKTLRPALNPAQAGYKVAQATLNSASASEFILRQPKSDISFAIRYKKREFCDLITVGMYKINTLLGQNAKESRFFSTEKQSRNQLRKFMTPPQE